MLKEEKLAAELTKVAIKYNLDALLTMEALSAVIAAIGTQKGFPNAEFEIMSSKVTLSSTTH